MTAANDGIDVPAEPGGSQHAVQIPLMQDYWLVWNLGDGERSLPYSGAEAERAAASDAWVVGIIDFVNRTEGASGHSYVPMTDAEGARHEAHLSAGYGRALDIFEFDAGTYWMPVRVLNNTRRVEVARFSVPVLSAISIHAGQYPGRVRIERCGWRFLPSLRHLLDERLRLFEHAGNYEDAGPFKAERHRIDTEGNIIVAAFRPELRDWQIATTSASTAGMAVNLAANSRKAYANELRALRAEPGWPEIRRQLAACRKANHDATRAMPNNAVE